ncbi:MAG TPA: extracellular solute-binding protein, partial [Fibrobacteria bacterium]|nr:extracellular solute-binding protein [Fibrobacteria bacterium]
MQGLPHSPSARAASFGRALRPMAPFLRNALGIALACLLTAPLASCGSRKEGKAPIRILWADWRPSDILAELGRDYETRTGIPVKVVKKSWDGAFADAAFAEFRYRGDNYDILIGDSQWLGLGAVGGHYRELTDWMKANLDLAALDSGALKWYSEYPRGSGRLWAVPCQADAMAWAYRKDLFEDSDHRKAFRGWLKDRNAADFPLAPPATWEELRLIALYFKERVPGMAGLVMPTSRRYDQATMSFEQVMWAYGGDFGDYVTNRVTVDSPRTVEALRFFASLMEATSPGGRNMGYGEVAAEFLSGRAAMAVTYYSFFPVFAN